jgi:glyoxylase-like metal-dependent hydrolase (beta-lactamase superfamily II)
MEKIQGEIGETMKQEIVRIDLGGVNAYLGKTDDGFILFDTGGHLTMDKPFTNRRDNLEKALKTAGCEPGNLKLVILTHGDNDHVANSAFIREKYQTKIAMHSDDTQLVENPTFEKMVENFRFRSLIFKIVSRVIKKLIQKVTQKALEDFERFKPDFYIDDGYSLSEYGFDAKIIHIPGHTAGSIGVLTADGDLIAGDTFANTNKPGIALNAYDFKMLAASVGRLKMMNLKTIYPGHGRPFEMKQFKK